MADPVLQTIPLGFQWQTMDPFLFCVHHLDHYPAGDGSLGPAASLDGREIGQDFAQLDGWNMYHGSHVPGFPSHPHRGFETVTFVRRGLIDHSDSLGAAARFGGGDVQWLTAGKGIVHAEMFPLVDTDGPNTTELFQIWLNLPGSHKMVDPYFTMLWDGDIPRLRTTDAAGRAIEVTVVAGRLGDLTPPPPPPDSWASQPDAEIAVWHLDLEAGAEWAVPPAEGADTLRTIYLFEGSSLDVGGHRIEGSTGAIVRAADELTLTAGPDRVSVLVLQGRPIGEPVAQYGPFVMNTRAEIQQAFDDYHATEFGGWPWPDTDPVHGDRTQGRFARHADGHLDEVVTPPVYN